MIYRLAFFVALVLPDCVSCGMAADVPQTRAIAAIVNVVAYFTIY